MTRLSTEERQEQIARAALDIIAEDGLDALSMPAVAKRVDVVPSAIYRHFSSKEEMMVAALDILFEAFKARLEAGEGGNEDALSACKRLLAIHREVLPKIIVLPRIIFGLPSGGARETLREMISRVLEELIGHLAGILREGQRRGQLRRDFDPDAAALQLWGILISATMRWYLTDGEFDVESYKNEAWDMFDRAVSRR
jgi:AcrR family transcriptional regulator